MKNNKGCTNLISSAQEHRTVGYSEVEIERLIYLTSSMSFVDQHRGSHTRSNMQGVAQAWRLHGNSIKNAVLLHFRLVNPVMRPFVFSRFESVTSARMEEHGFESATIADILKAKGKGADGSWLWCTTEDTVYDAVKSMTQHNVGALVVVKPGEQKSIAGIITERDYLRKIIVQGRSSKSTKVGDIMTEENKLVTVDPHTKVLRAMQLMTDNRIRHIPVVDDKGMVGMVSIGDVPCGDEHCYDRKGVRMRFDATNIYQ
ncbi:hypothetical protein Nepgr_015238 [Nepenthes gracilis]|uniref:CBS domain-containing protein n=1 Tax=Nepenthes gracilis TaxID=150966 RepID=A0AAD3SMX2_NEPGR|nr:hypothetical protein Nepgr_015238 [Nepenthes gracilis]